MVEFDPGEAGQHHFNTTCNILRAKAGLLTSDS